MNGIGGPQEPETPISTGPNKDGEKTGLMKKISEIAKAAFQGAPDLGIASGLTKLTRIIASVINYFTASPTTKNTNDLGVNIVGQLTPSQQFEQKVDHVLQDLYNKPFALELMEDFSVDDDLTDTESVATSSTEGSEEAISPLEKAKGQLVEDLNRKCQVEYEGLDGKQITLSLEKASKETGISLSDQKQIRANDREKIGAGLTESEEIRAEETGSLKEHLRKQIDGLPEDVVLNVAPYVNQGFLASATKELSSKFISEMSAIPILTAGDQSWVFHVKDLGEKNYEICMGRDVTLAITENRELDSRAGASNVEAAKVKGKQVHIETSMKLSPGKPIQETFTFSKAKFKN